MSDKDLFAKAFDNIKALSNIKYTIDNAIGVIAEIEGNRKDLISENKKLIKFFIDVENICYTERSNNDVGIDIRNLLEVTNIVLDKEIINGRN